MNDFEKQVFRSAISKYGEIKDYADKRKSTNLTRFDFCPMCGEKIDWKAIGMDKR